MAPLLKWAGGKRQLLDALSQHYPARFDRYFEPFFGSGAVFFDLLSRGLLDGKDVRLSDANPDLVGCYRTVRDQTTEVARALRALEREHRLDGDRCYYAVRDTRFNPIRQARLVSGPQALLAAYTPELAAMLIFLNRTGFNGLFRLNRHGGFNVPAGRYVDPRICDPDHLARVAAAFGRAGVTIDCHPFAEALAGAGADDFVYCDPPYVPLSRTASFASYTAAGFSLADQRQLQQAVVAASTRGAFVVVSNSSADEVAREYGTQAAVKARLRINKVPARRAINSKATLRGVVDEFIISNVDPRVAAVPLRMARMTARPRPERRRSA